MQTPNPPIIASHQRMDELNAETADFKWKRLYQAGGAGALIVGTLLIIEMVFYIATAALSLTDAAAWFALFQNDRIVGLIDFGILERTCLASRCIWQRWG